MRATLEAMTDRAAQLLDEFLKLSEAERAEFAAAILALQDGPAPDPEEQARINDAWRIEIRRRLEQALAGEAGTPAAEVLAEMRNRHRRAK